MICVTLHFRLPGCCRYIYCNTGNTHSNYCYEFRARSVVYGGRSEALNFLKLVAKTTVFRCYVHCTRECSTVRQVALAVRFRGLRFRRTPAPGWRRPRAVSWMTGARPGCPGARADSAEETRKVAITESVASSWTPGWKRGQSSG